MTKRPKFAILFYYLTTLLILYFISSPILFYAQSSILETPLKEDLSGFNKPLYLPNQLGGNPIHLSEINGLNSIHIMTMEEDEEGNIYIGTDEDVYTWDGNKAVELQIPSHPNYRFGYVNTYSLKWNNIHSKLFISTKKGLHIYDPITREMEIFSLMENDVGQLTCNHIGPIFFDNENNIWIGSDNGLVSFDYENRKFKFFKFSAFQNDIKTSKEYINYVLSLTQDLTNMEILWIGTVGGLIKFNKSDKSFDYIRNNRESSSGNKYNCFPKMGMNPEGLLYLATWTDGMVVFDSKSEKFTDQLLFSTEKKGVLSRDIQPIMVYRGEDLLLVSRNDDDTLQIINTENDIRNLFHINKDNCSARQITFCYQDRNNKWWFGSEFCAFILDPNRQLFRNFSMENDPYVSFPQDLLETEKYIFLNHRSIDHIKIFDKKNQRISDLNIPRFGSDNTSFLNQILSIDSSRLLLHDNNNLIEYNFISGKFLERKFSDSIELTLILHKTEDEFYFFSAEGNIYLWNNKTEKEEIVFSPKEDAGVNDFLTYKNIIQDQYGNFIIGRRLGIAYVDIKAKTINLFNDTKLPVFFRSQIIVDPDQNILIGDSDGNLMLLEARSLKEIQTEDSKNIIDLLDGRRVISFCLDLKKRLWINTGSLLLCYNYLSKEGRIIDPSYGLAGWMPKKNRSQMEGARLYLRPNGEITILYRNGFGFFNPDTVLNNKNLELPKPYIVRFWANDSLILQSSASKAIRLEHDQNEVRIEYSAFANHFADRVRFTHQLSSIDKKPKESSSRIAKYNNLSPGKYTFTINASNNLGLESPSYEYIFFISPPWWASWWAYGLYSIAVLGLIMILYRFQFKRQIAENEAARLKELDQLKSQLYTNITHEFRTPLTVIQGISDRIKEKLDSQGNESILPSLDMISRNSNNLLHLVNQMLDLAKVKQGKLALQMSQADVLPFLKYITESFQSMAESKDIQLVYYSEQDELVMDFDSEKLMVIVSNILSNAIKYTSSQGRIVFHTSQSEKDAKKFLIIKVQDTGIGISKENIIHVFDRFYQVDRTNTRSGEGTGIGLALAREMSELMEGRIEVKSQLGKGTEFSVSIPITNVALRKTIKQVIPFQATIGLESIDKSNSVLTNNSKLPLILIVEDNVDVATYLRQCLEDQYSIIHAKNGEIGIELAIEQIPDLIISDIMMPIKDGYELCKTVKSDIRTNHIPVILLTAKVTLKDRIEGLELGADAYLAKPFNKAELFTRITQLLKLRKELQQKFSHTLDLGLNDNSNLNVIFIERATSTILKKMGNENFRALSLAKELGLSESQLYRKLKALTGKSTGLFIRSIRLQKANKMLHASDMNISQIAYEVGFKDPAWFSRAFKEEFGVPPKSIRS